MFDYIKGKLVELNPAEAVVETGGFGYRISISLGTFTKLQNDGSESVKLYLYHFLREDEEGFYGFWGKEERALFLLLISVSGVGASTARTILSSMSAEELASVISAQDVNRLKSVKGIGLKTAQRLILELKDKVGTAAAGAADTAAGAADPIRSEASSALILLGFARPAVERAIDAVLRENPSCSIEDLIKKSLKIL